MSEFSLQSDSSGGEAGVPAAAVPHAAPAQFGGMKPRDDAQGPWI